MFARGTADGSARAGARLLFGLRLGDIEGIESVEAKVTSIERKNRRISLSVKALEVEIEGEAIQEYARKTTVGSTALGDKLKEQLSKNTAE